MHKEDSALARWVADPANTAWMESKYHWLPGSSPGSRRTLPGGMMGFRQVLLIILMSWSDLKLQKRIHLRNVLTGAVTAVPGPL